MTDQAGTAGGPNSSSSTAAALQRAALRSRVRTITDGAVELSSEAAAGGVVGQIVDGHAYAHLGEVRGLGGVLRWATSNGADLTTVIAESDVSGDVCRRASLFDFPIDVWSADGVDVEKAQAAPILQPPEIPDAHRRYGPVITETGARAIDDHGMLIAEVAGLEVARVVDGESGEGPELAVGVGQADRELQQYIHGHLDDDANLRRAIAAVVRYRKPGSAAHPLTRLARQRWLRSILLDTPSLVGLDDLEPVVPLRARDTVLGDEPTAAATEGAIVVCSVGVDLDLLPEAVDYRYRTDQDAELVVVLPERDRQLAIGSLAALVPNLRVVSIDAPWDPRS